MTLTSKPVMVALLLALLVLIVPAAVVHSIEPATTVTANATIRVRSGPGTNYAQISLLQAGTTVPVLGRNSDASWLYVEYTPGAQGWVAGWLVTPNGDVNSLPVIGQGAPAQPPAAPAGVVTTGVTTPSVNLRPQPNTSQPPVAVIPGGSAIDVYGRNAAATWLYSAYLGQQGWVSAAYVVLASGPASALPVVGQQPSPTPAPTPAPSPSAGYASYIHNITPRARQIFLNGQTQGNRASVFSKAGDSITATWAFLNKIGDGIYSLNDYAYLQPVIGYFSSTTARTGNSFNNASLAAVEGWTSFDLLDPTRTDPMCPGLTPIACEYTMVRPSAAIIMIGTNDVLRGIDRGAYGANLGRIIETSIQYGVIPVLSTIPYNGAGDAPAYNAVIVSTAEAYDIPWMDFYAATVNLPNHGNDPDNIHPAVPPTHDPTNFTPDTIQYGHTVRTLLTLRMLDAVWGQALAP